MKKVSTPFLLFIVLILIISCSESFLKQVPQGSTSENIFYNEKGIDALLTGTYAMVKGSSLWEVRWGASIQNWIYGSVASDDAYIGSDRTALGTMNQIECWNASPDDSNPADKWRLNIGMGVNRANTLLNIISKTKDLDAAKATEFKAEARFLRGLFYFESWLVFGDKIPLIPEEKMDLAATISNDNPQGAVLAFIIADLKYAWENLPETQAQAGRPTRYAAMALAARAYLLELKYTEAKPLLDNIIASGRYSLMPCFHDNYRVDKNNNGESIFEIQACVNDMNESLNAEMGIGLNYPHGSDIGMCCGFHQPSQNLANAFKVDADGLPLFDTFNNTDLANDQGIASEDNFVPATDALDPRIDYTMGRRGIPYLDWGIMRGRDWIRDQPWGGPYLPCEKPFFNKADRYKFSTTTGWMTGVNANNYRYIRYAHVLLWRAEVAAWEGDYATVLNYVNKIRTRAGHQVVMGRVSLTKLPPSEYPWGAGQPTGYMDPANTVVDWTQPAANYHIGTYTSFANKDEAMRAVQWELRLEFATEGMRFFDLRRWDKATVGHIDMSATLNAFALADLRLRDAMKDAVFTEKAKYMPVPQGQIDLEPGVLTQNPGY
ncbi:MAG TPA: RagB/SusD family nutrient uptake outer membrane protein [Bacteroidales bacterium]|nr:RagB/SusD family nutrient uptake outer membrane protein [Bacteroidales bacterium]